MKTWFAAITVALVLVAAPALAQTDEDVTAAINLNFGDAEPFVEAFDAIQAAVADDDAEAFAQWVSYPFEVTVDGEAYVFDEPAGVVEHYESMMTEEIKTAILEQQYKDLFVNAEGVMFGDGQVWLSGICKDEACAAFDARIVTVQSAAN